MKKILAVILLAGIVFAQVGVTAPTVSVNSGGTEGLPFEH